jgi:telomere length regulation protein
LSQPDNFGGAQEDKERDAPVSCAALELALAVLDAAIDLDTGRSLAVDAPQLVLAAGEWAGGVFEAENGGVGGKAAGGGGSREGRLRAAAAGVVVKVAEIGDKWGRR